MTDEQTAGIRLLETGALVEFQIVSVQLHPGPDDGEFGVQVELRLGMDDDESEEVVQWGGFGFIFVLGALSFADARPRGVSTSA